MRKCARLFCLHLPGCFGRAEGYLASATSSSRGGRPGERFIWKGPRCSTFLSASVWEPPECDSPRSERYAGFPLDRSTPRHHSAC